MILVDSSVWVDHFRGSNEQLIDELLRDGVGCHPFVVEELALSSLAARVETIAFLSNLSSFPVLSHDEVIKFVGMHSLWSRGLSMVDAHLLGSTLLVPGATLWTHDRRLRDVAALLGVEHAVGGA